MEIQEQTATAFMIDWQLEKSVFVYWAPTNFDRFHV